MGITDIRFQERKWYVMNIKIQEYSVTPTTLIAGTQGSEGVFRLTFSFDSSWDGLAKKAVFAMPDGTCIYRSVRADEVIIPREVLQTRGKCRCFLVGRRGRRRLVSAGCDLIVLATAGFSEEVSE